MFEDFVFCVDLCFGPVWRDGYVDCRRKTCLGLLSGGSARHCQCGLCVLRFETMCYVFDLLCECEDVRFTGAENLRGGSCMTSLEVRVGLINIPTAPKGKKSLRRFLGRGGEDVCQLRFLLLAQHKNKLSSL